MDEYLNLKVQHPDKLIGVQVGEYMLFYGKDAEEAAPALVPVSACSGSECSAAGGSWEKPSNSCCQRERKIAASCSQVSKPTYSGCVTWNPRVYATVPLFTSEQITRFEYLLRQDPRNKAVSEYLSTDTDLFPGFKADI